MKYKKLQCGHSLLRHNIFPEMDKVVEARPYSDNHVGFRILQNVNMSSSTSVVTARLQNRHSKSRRLRAGYGSVLANAQAFYKVKLAADDMPYISCSSPRFFYGAVLDMTNLTGIEIVLRSHIFDRCTLYGCKIVGNSILNPATRGTRLIFKNSSFERNAYIHERIECVMQGCSGVLKTYSHSMFRNALRDNGFLEDKESFRDGYICTAGFRTKLMEEDLKRITGLKPIYRETLTEILTKAIRGINLKMRQYVDIRSKERVTAIVPDKSMLDEREYEGRRMLCSAATFPFGCTTEPYGMMLADSESTCFKAKIEYHGYKDDTVFLANGVLLGVQVVPPLLQRTNAKRIYIRNALVHVATLTALLSWLGDGNLVPGMIILEDCVCTTDLPLGYDYAIIKKNCTTVNILDILRYGCGDDLGLLHAFISGTSVNQSTISAELVGLDTKWLKKYATQTPSEGTYPEYVFPFTKKKGL